MNSSTGNIATSHTQGKPGAEEIRRIRGLLNSAPARAIDEVERHLRIDASSSAPYLDADVRMRMLFLCAEACDYVDDPARMDHYVECCRAVAPLLDRAEDKVYYLEYLAVYFHYTGQRSQAIENAESAIRLAADSGLGDRPVNQALGILGVLHYDVGNYDIALMYRNRQRQLLSQMPPSGKESTLFYSLALIYQELGHDREALDSYERSIHIARTRRMWVSLASVLNSMGGYYVERQQSEKALVCVTESQKLTAACQVHNLRMANALLSAQIRLLRNDYKTAVQLVDGVLSASRHSAKYTYTKVHCMHLLGTVYLAQGRLNKARCILHDLANIAAAGDLRREQARAYQTLSRAEEQRGNHKQALHYFRLSAECWRKPPEPELQERMAAFSVLQSGTTEQREPEEQSAYLGDPDIRLILGLLNNPQNQEIRRFAGGRSKLSERDGPTGAAGGDTWLNAYHLLSSLKQNVTRRASALTSTEVRICLLIACGLQSKEIARLLSNSVETINTHRKNIRKKLGLGQGRNLATFLSSL